MQGTNTLGTVFPESFAGSSTHLTYVVVALLHAEASESQRGLPSAAVLLGQLHAELAQDLPRVAADGAEQAAVPVHHHEPVPAQPGVSTRQQVN